VSDKYPLELERDKWKHAHDNQGKLKRILMERPDLKERTKLISEVITERNQLRKIVDELANVVSSYDDRFKWKSSVIELYNSLPHVKERNAK
jgi:hypothetical protein